MSIGVGSVCQGKVAWFDADKGYGFIAFPEGEGKDIFVHYSGILTSGFKTLRDEDEVEFTVSEGSGGRLQASQVSILNRPAGSKNDRQGGKGQRKKQ